MTTHGLLSPGGLASAPIAGFTRWTEDWYGDVDTFGNTPGSVGFPGTPTAAPATTVGSGGVTLPLVNGTVPITDCAQLDPNGGLFTIGGFIVEYSGRSVASGAGNATGCWTDPRPGHAASGTYPSGTALGFTSIGWSVWPVKYEVLGADGIPLPGSIQGEFNILASKSPTLTDSFEGFSWLVILADPGSAKTQHKTVTTGEFIAQLAGQWSMPDGYTAPLKSFGFRTHVGDSSYAKNAVGVALSHNSAGGTLGWTENYDGLLQLVSARETYGTVNGAHGIGAGTLAFTGATKRPRVPDPGTSITVLIGSTDGGSGQYITYTDVTGSGTTGTLTGVTGIATALVGGETIGNNVYAVNVKDRILSATGFAAGASGYSGSIVAAIRGGPDSIVSMLAITGPSSTDLPGTATLLRINAGSGQSRGLVSIRDSGGSERFAVSSGGTPILKGVALAAQTGGGTNTAAIDGTTGYVQCGNTGGAGAKEWSGSGAPTTPGGALTYNLGDKYWRTDTPGTANQRLYIVTIAGTSPTWTGIV